MLRAAAHYSQNPLVQFSCQNYTCSGYPLMLSLRVQVTSCPQTHRSLIPSHTLALLVLARPCRSLLQSLEPPVPLQLYSSVSNNDHKTWRSLNTATDQQLSRCPELKLYVYSSWLLILGGSASSPEDKVQDVSNLVEMALSI